MDEEKKVRPVQAEIVKIQFMAVGNAPIMKRAKFMVSGKDSLFVVREKRF